MINQIINLSLRSRLLMLVLAVLVVVAGYRSYQQLPVDAFPDVSPNLVQVFTITEGLAPEEIEMYVTYPVEAAMTGLPSIEKIRSVSNFGLSVVNIYFKDEVDIYFARQLVGERLQEARNQIPASFGEPSMGPISTGMGLILFYYLNDTTDSYSLEDLRTMQDWIVKFNLQTVRGVTEVLGIGGFEKQFQVIVQPDALLRYQLTLNEILARIKANNLNVGAQYLEKNSEQFIIRSVGLATNIADLNNIVVKTVDGRAVYLSEVAEIKIGGALRRGLQTHNGQGEVVAGMAIKLYGTNASTVIERVENKIKEINKTLPEGVSIVPYYQQKDIVESAVNTVNNALIQGIILVALVLLIFMGGFRPSLVVALSIPFSVMFAFIAMGLFNLSANLMSLGGLAIAIGMMVDGTIVMVENVDRLLRESDRSESHFSVVSRACREVGQPILFAIAIIIIVFLPLFTLEGVEGKTFRPLAYTVALAMLGSLIYALFLAPVLSDVLMRRKSVEDQDKIGLDERILNALLTPYRPVVKYFIQHRSVAVIMSVGLLIVGMVIFPFLGSEFTPKLQEGTIVVRLTMPPSISINESKRNTLIVERRLLKIPEIIEVTSRIGRGEVGAHADPINSAEMYVILKPKDEWRKPNNQAFIEQEIRQVVAKLPGITANLTQPIEMTVDELLEGVRAELAVKLFGDDLTQLKTKADEIASVIKQVKGAADVQVDQVSGTPQLVIIPDRHAIARYGLNISDVQDVVSSAIGGVNAGQVFEGIRRFEILLRYREQDRNTPEVIRNLLITGENGIKVPLGQVATVKEIIGPRQITRENNQRFISIQANVIDRDIVSFVEEAQQAINSKIKLPPGYFTTWGGQFRLQQEANKRLAIVIPVTLLIISLLLYSSFNSLKNAGLILLNIPLALVGGVIALWISGQNLSVPASVGFIALFGIALENGMVLLTYLNQLVRDGMPIDEASIKGACLRMRPVLMTAVTTALGLIPLLLASGTGSEVQKPLATVVIGGLVTSTLLTLLVIPALYKWFAVKS
ncbi:MAG: CusA/CzcA family heavy metal efflux RND transporter [Methylococcales bacterium]|nr:CusA/CzcA family heavy metal efflux RND transporter [Methylococcales bacterium]